MADDTKKSVRQIQEGVKGIARGSPAIAYGQMLERIGKKVIEVTPEPIRRYGRRLRTEAQQLMRGATQRGRVRRHQRMRRSASRSRR